MKNGHDLRGNIVVHGTGVRDLYYGVPNLGDYEFIEQVCEKTDSGSLKVQLKFQHKITKEYFDILLMPDRV